MSIIIYHKNLKKIFEKKLSKNRNINHYKQIGSELVLSGMKEGYDIKTQIGIYIAYINQFQRMKLYKLPEADIEYYITCVLALWKLEILDPDSPTEDKYAVLKEELGLPYDTDEEWIEYIQSKSSTCEKCEQYEEDLKKLKKFTSRCY